MCAEGINIGDDLRQAMRGVAATVTVITAGSETVRHAMAATSFSVLSIEPPLILVCINQSSLIKPLLQLDAAFCVNILSIQHEGIADACGRKDQRGSRFESGHFVVHPIGAPMLEDAQSNLVCEVEALHDYGTHTIVIGCVTEVILSGSIRPLIYLDGRYRTSCVTMSEQSI